MSTGTAPPAFGSLMIRRANNGVIVCAQSEVYTQADEFVFTNPQSLGHFVTEWMRDDGKSDTVIHKPDQKTIDMNAEFAAEACARGDIK